MTKYADGKIGMTEMIERAEVNVPFVIPAYGKKEAHKAMRDAHVAASRKNRKVSTSIMRAVDISDYEYHMTLIRVTVVESCEKSVYRPQFMDDIDGDALASAGF